MEAPWVRRAAGPPLPGPRRLRAACSRRAALRTRLWGAGRRRAVGARGSRPRDLAWGRRPLGCL